ncbi:hypothetical protein AVEN_164625-1 [Araneus ventricosus]|uniref:Uncharacterized protein n=1 Tax=Araneus ventricosus TaxID=182803 RepID=A0A4Y2WC86_ARAVE|nr:hypothetical protein AVEN_164625-1 [Araneus ventricosus]
MADDKGKESKPGIAGQDSCSRCSRRRIEAESPDQSQARREIQPFIVAASQDKLPIKLKLDVKIYPKTSEVQGKLLNIGKYFTRNVVFTKKFFE